MLISICIPSYNKVDIIETTIASVLKNIQFCLLKNVNAQFEFVIIDDRSNDGTYELLQNLPLGQSYSLYQNKQNVGLVENWNQCINKSSGDYILILHSDDILVDGALNLYVEYLEKNPDAKFLHGNAIDITIPFFKSRKRITQNKVVVKKGDEAIIKILLNNNLACSTVMVSKDCYNRLGPFDVNAWVSPDWEMWARIGSQYNLHHLEHVTAYVIHNNRNTHVSGIPIEIFKNQQLYYINKILQLLKKDENYYKERAIENLDKTLWLLSIKYSQIENRAIAKEYIHAVRETNAKRLKRIFLINKAGLKMLFMKLFHKQHSLEHALVKLNKIQ